MSRFSRERTLSYSIVGSDFEIMWYTTAGWGVRHFFTFLWSSPMMKPSFCCLVPNCFVFQEDLQMTEIELLPLILSTVFSFSDILSFQSQCLNLMNLYHFLQFRTSHFSMVACIVLQRIVLTSHSVSYLKCKATRSQSDITDAPCLKFYSIITLFIHRWRHFKFVKLLHKISFT